VPSVLDGVRAHGVWLGRKRVERLMRRAGISGLAPRSAAAPRSACPGVRIADNLVERRFRPARANVLWVADITYPRSCDGWLYLAAVQDAFSCQIVGSWPSICAPSS
jgi:putative transposase